MLDDTLDLSTLQEEVCLSACKLSWHPPYLSTLKGCGAAAEKYGYDLKAVAVPKTIDNDLAVTDNCPGFGSVAKYVAISAKEASLDVKSMCKTSTKVFVLEGSH